MGLREVKAELQSADKETLIKHISELYKKYKPVQEYFDFYVNPNEAEIIEKYKEQVREGFYPKRGYKLRLSISRKAINDFKKLGTSKAGLCDLLLYFVECGVEFTNAFGDIDESFYESVENTYSNALKTMKENGILNTFHDRASGIVKDSEETGWGFHDYLGDEYFEYYG